MARVLFFFVLMAFGFFMVWLITQVEGAPERARKRSKPPEPIKPAGPPRRVEQDGDVWRVFDKDGEQELLTYSEQLARFTAEELDRVDPLPASPKPKPAPQTDPLPASPKPKPAPQTEKKPMVLPPNQPTWETQASALRESRRSLDSREMFRIMDDMSQAFANGFRIPPPLLRNRPRCHYCRMEMVNHTRRVQHFERAGGKSERYVVCQEKSTGQAHRTKLREE